MRKVLAAIAGTALVLGAWLIVPGLAASMTDTSNTEGAGNTGVSQCDTGIVTTFNNSTVTPFPVISVTVSGIASACGGLTMSVTVKNSSASTATGSTTIAAGGGSATIVLVPATLAETDVMETDFAVTG